MKKYLLIPALALIAAPVFAEGEGAARPESETQAITFSVNSQNSWAASWSMGTHSGINFEDVNGHINLYTISDPSAVKSVKITLSELSDPEGGVRLVLQDDDYGNSDPFILIQETGKECELTIPDDWQSKSQLTVDLQRANTETDVTVSATVSRLIIEYTDGTTEKVTKFTKGTWGYGTVPSTSGTITMKGDDWAGITITDADGNDIVWDPVEDAEVTYTIYVYFKSLGGEMLFEYDHGVPAGTDYVNTENDRVQPGATYAKLVINKDCVTKNGVTIGEGAGLSLDRLYLKNWGNSGGDDYDVVINGGTLTKTKYTDPTPEPDPVPDPDEDPIPDPTSLRPAQAPTVLSTDYISLVGIRSATPHRGLNIIRQTLSDGSVRVSKAILK